MTLTPGNTAAVLLAAGASTRFGGDKLSAPLRGAPLIDHAAAALASSQCAWRTIIVGATMAGSPGFETVVNPDSSEGLSTSIRTGVIWAESKGAKGVLIALADMPFINPSHYPRLFETANTGANQCAFTISASRRSPPALFGESWFSQLLDLTGDEGARRLLAAQPESSGVVVTELSITDIDTRDDLMRFEDNRGAAPE